MVFKWKRYGGYEVSTKGDERFSAFCAIMPDNRALECHYQCDVKRFDIGGSKWWLGKGKPPNRFISREALYEEYKALWIKWAVLNPELMEELRYHAENCGGILSDCFATSDINQARALSELLNEGYGL